MPQKEMIKDSLADGTDQPEHYNATQKWIKRMLKLLLDKAMQEDVFNDIRLVPIIENGVIFCIGF
eukprot:CAMPEP_0169309842 /NCGR_PEP_ID=MMETSP1017-20121227/2637_1 /TAXON_ID=342587 /ORGANISM="Karlodinium micrum, Strain CCMP2283" /LENGTH=64 /DNA_ID=CAMNT_0009403415 /DNA_START=50 /DNA_END=241 /DNA_ORIENTATION=+